MGQTAQAHTCLEMASVRYVALYTTADLPPPSESAFRIFPVRLGTEGGVILNKTQYITTGTGIEGATYA